MLRLLPRPHPSGASTKLGPVGHGVSLQASCELIHGLELPFPACFLGTLVLENGIRDWSKVLAREFVLSRMTSAKDPDCMNVETISPPPPVSAGVVPAARGEAKTSLLSRALLVIAMLYVVVRALPILTFPMGCDHGTYLTIGEGLLEGKQLYRDLWDNKPPGTFITYAAIAKIFGRAMWSAAVVDILLLLVISYLLFRFTEPYIGRAGAAIAVIVNASMHGEMKYFWIAQPETFQVICVLAGYFLILRGGRGRWLSSFAAGIVFGYAFWLKYNAIAFLPFLLVLPFLDLGRLDDDPPRFTLKIGWRDWLSRAGLFFIGFAAVFCAVMAWIVLKGAWPAMREAQFEVLPRYAAMAVQRRPHYFLSTFTRTNYLVGVWNLWAVIAGLLVSRFRRDLRRFAPLFLAAVSAYIAPVMQVRFHDYYFQICYPFLAAIWAYLVVSLFEGARALARVFRQRGWRLAFGLVWIVFAQAVFWPIPREFNNLFERYEELREWAMDPETFYSLYPRQMPFEHSKGEFAAIDYLNSNAKPSDGVYVWSFNCQIYYLTGHQPPTRFVSNLGIMSLWSPPRWRDELMRDLKRSEPRFIVVARGDQLPVLTYVNLDSETYLKKFREFDSFIRNDYKVAADFDTFVVYERTVSRPGL